MTEEVKIIEKKTTKKTAPKVVVKSSGGVAKTIDDLFRMNPAQGFIYAPEGTDKDVLAAEGLEPVVGSNGKAMTNKGRVICRKVNNHQDKQIQSAYREATRRIKGVRDLELSDSVSGEPRRTKLPADVLEDIEQ